MLYKAKLFRFQFQMLQFVYNKEHWLLNAERQEFAIGLVPLSLFSADARFKSFRSISTVCVWYLICSLVSAAYVCIMEMEYFRFTLLIIQNIICMRNVLLVCWNSCLFWTSHCSWYEQNCLPSFFSLHVLKSNNKQTQIPDILGDAFACSAPSLVYVFVNYSQFYETHKVHDR